MEDVSNSGSFDTEHKMLTSSPAGNILTVSLDLTIMGLPDLIGQSRNTMLVVLKEDSQPICRVPTAIDARTRQLTDPSIYIWQTLNRCQETFSDKFALPIARRSDISRIGIFFLNPSSGMRRYDTDGAGVDDFRWYREGRRSGQVDKIECRLQLRL